jgi:hypothetical protein
VNNGGALDGDAILQLVTLGGNPKGFAPSYFDSGSGTGFSDSGGSPIAEPQIPVGGGFMFDNLVGPAVTWTQIFNP